MEVSNARQSLPLDRSRPAEETGVRDETHGEFEALVFVNSFTKIGEPFVARRPTSGSAR
jgi:hypothetical protein